MSEPITNRPADYKPLQYKPTIKDRWFDLREWTLSWLYYTPKRWINNVSRLIYWLPVIWNDNDYDHNSLYKIVDHKLASIEQASKDWHWIGNKDQTKKIGEIRHWIEKTIADEFDLVDDECQDHVDKYGELTSWTTETEINGKKMYQMHLGYTKCFDELTAKQASDEFDKITKLAIERHNMYRNRVWKSISKHVERWWD